MADITQILNAIEAGDPHAADELLPLVYDELRRLAAAKMAGEKPGHTLDATALVHEAYFRLTGNQQFDSRRHFYSAAAEAMRRILVDSARRKKRHKRGGQLERLDLDPDLITQQEPDERLLALDEAIERFTAQEPQKAELLKLRSFGGLTLEQASILLNISPATADRWWAYARAWLRVELSGEEFSEE